MGVGSLDEVGHEREGDALEKSEGRSLPRNRDSILVCRYECSECPCGAPGESDEKIRELRRGRRKKERTLG